VHRGPRPLTATALLLVAVLGLAAPPAQADEVRADEVRADEVRSTTSDDHLVPARPSDSIVDAYGVGVHLAYSNTPYADADAVAAAISDLGVRHVRDDLYLGRDDQYAAMAKVAAAGARFDLIMGRPGTEKTPADYVAAAAALPAGTVESLEGVNEWDLFGPPDTWATEARTWQQDLYTAAHANAATAGLPVLSPALAFKSHYADLGDLSASADVANVHTYPGGATPSSEILQMIAAVRQVVASGAVMTTEAGYHNATAADTSGPGVQPGVPEQVAAYYLPRLLLEHQWQADRYGTGETRTYSYELIDEFADPELTDPEAHFGLLRHDLTPKPAYTAMKNLLALVSDPGPAFATAPLRVSVDGFADIGDARYLLTEKRDGTYVLLLWRDVSLYDTSSGQRTSVKAVPTTLRLGNAARLAVFEPSVGAGPVARARGTSIPLSLGGQVVAVTIDALEPPGRPDVRARSPKPHRVKVRWAAPSANGHRITKYRVSFDGAVKTVGADTHRLTWRGLPSGRSGRVKVRAHNSDGWGPAGRSAVIAVR
jgi:hypothetical protein